MEPNSFEGGPFNERRYYGKYRGIVMDVQDPERLGRIKCRVLEVLGKEIITDWAWPATAWYGGMRDYGHFVVPEVGSSVFLEFESGDVNRPLYGGCWWGHPKGQPPDPPQLTRTDKETTYQSDDSIRTPKGDDVWRTADCQTMKQPRSPLVAKAPPKYPFNQVLKTKNNQMIIEVDDTPGQGRIHIWHGPSKSWIELDMDGELSIRIASRAYIQINGDEQHHVGQNKHVYVEGKMTDRVGGDRWLKVEGDEKRTTIGKKDSWVLGSERKINQADLTEWVAGNKLDVVFGNYSQIVVGNYTTSVFGNYERIAAGNIIDKAKKIFHRSGKPTIVPPGPPSPPCPG